MTEQNKNRTKSWLPVIFSGIFVAVALFSMISQNGQLTERVNSSQSGIQRLCIEKLDKEVFRQFLDERENRLKTIEGMLERMERKIDQHMNQK